MDAHVVFLPPRATITPNGLCSTATTEFLVDDSASAINFNAPGIGLQLKRGRCNRTIANGTVGTVRQIEPKELNSGGRALQPGNAGVPTIHFPLHTRQSPGGNNHYIVGQPRNYENICLPSETTGTRSGGTQDETAAKSGVPSSLPSIQRFMGAAHLLW
ncbi:unnamed protein product [Ixodes pacificus]